MAAIQILTLNTISRCAGTGSPNGRHPDFNLNTMSCCVGSGSPDGGHPDFKPKYNGLLCRD
jgi:hypothetical protein